MCSSDLNLASTILLTLMAGCYEATTPRVGIPTLDALTNDGFIAVSAGREHSCALTADGSAFCWGSNEFGQLGSGSVTTCPREDRNIPCSPWPVAVTGGIRFTKISAGGAHTCGLGTDARAYCWGDNFLGALGDPGLRQSLTPTPVVTSATFLDLSAGGEHSCGVRTDGVALCWGANDRSQVGTLSSAGSFGLPVSASTSQRFVSIVAGDRRTCARTTDGAVYCWGATFVNSSGGADVIRTQQTPARVQSPVAFKAITVGRRATCAVSIGNDAFCWEGNATGAVGDGTVSGSISPVPVTGGLKFVAVSSGDTHTCAIAESGFAHCWGGGAFGELGISPVFLRLRCGAQRTLCQTSPARVSGWRVFVQISAGQGNHSCGLTLGGSVYCWGAGAMGQRGDGRISRAEWSPVKTGLPQDVTAIVTGDTALLRLKS